jgi:hypothetical protein
MHPRLIVEWLDCLKEMLFTLWRPGRLKGARLRNDPIGETFVAAMQASPYREIELEPTRCRLPVRDVIL